MLDFYATGAYDGRYWLPIKPMTCTTQKSYFFHAVRGWPIHCGDPLPSMGNVAGALVCGPQSDLYVSMLHGYLHLLLRLDAIHFDLLQKSTPLCAYYIVDI